MIYTRIASGLDFIDAEFGGIYANRTYYLRGPARSGRTTIGLQFLLAGLENGENSILISSDRIEDVILKSETIGLTLEQYLVENRLILMEYPKEIQNGHYQLGGVIHLLGEIEKYIKTYNCTRIVFDTLMPLLLKARDAQVANYVYSLMNAIEALSCTAFVTTGEPNSPQAGRIAELIEDAAAGVFSTSAVSMKDSQQRMFWVHKMVNPMTPPTPYKTKFEYGTGVVQDLGERAPDIRRPNTVEQVTGPVSINDLPMRIAVIDGEEDVVAQFEEIFPKAQQVDDYSTDSEFIRGHRDVGYDVLVVNASSVVNWFLAVHQIRERNEKLPILIVSEQLTAQLSYQSAKLAGADALFMHPLVKGDVVRALEKALKNYNTYQEIASRLATRTQLSNLPEDFGSLLNTVMESDLGGKQGDTLISVGDFKEKLHEQIWRSSQKQLTFAVVSFRMINTGEISKLQNLPRGLELVKRMAGIVGNAMRGLNDSACRSMDKIVVLLENCDREGADAFVARVTADVKTELGDKLGVQLGRHLVISKAMAMYPEDADNVQDLLSRVTETTRNFKLIH